MPTRAPTPTPVPTATPALTPTPSPTPAPDAPAVEVSEGESGDEPSVGSEAAEDAPDVLPGEPDPTVTTVPELTAVETEEMNLLRLHQINIGYGSAYLLTVDDLVILVDCGTNTTDPIETGQWNYPLFDYLAASGIDHVDAHIVTHWHNDHCYNVNILGEMYGTEETVVYGVTDELYPALDPLAAGTYRRVRDGDRFAIGPLDVLCVGPVWREGMPGDRNMDSMNLILTYGEIRIMITGDALRSNIIYHWREEITDMDVLIFPHHGNELQEVPRYAYRAINPRLVLISSRERGRVREFALHRAGVTQEAVYLSYLNGHILVTTDGRHIWYAEDVQPGTLPIGMMLPPRTHAAPQ